MSDILEETVHDTEVKSLFCKPPGLNNPKAYVLTHKRFYTFMVLIFSDLNGAQNYKKPFKDSQHS